MVRPLKKLSLVYMAINIVNGKLYIGMTSKTVHKRAIEHRCEARRGSKYLLHKAMRKYGEENIKFIVLERCESYAAASKKEIEFIKGMKPEYNLTAGGEGQLGRKLSDYQKSIIHAPRSKESKAKSRANGFRHKNEWMKRSHLGPEASSKKVICLDDGGIFESASAAARHYKTAKSALIELCLKSPRRKTVAGRRFEYYEEVA